MPFVNSLGSRTSAVAQAASASSVVKSKRSGVSEMPNTGPIVSGWSDAPLAPVGSPKDATPRRVQRRRDGRQRGEKRDSVSPPSRAEPSGPLAGRFARWLVTGWLAGPSRTVLEARTHLIELLLLFGGEMLANGSVRVLADALHLRPLGIRL